MRKALVTAKHKTVKKKLHITNESNAISHFNWFARYENTAHSITSTHNAPTIQRSYQAASISN